MTSCVPDPSMTLPTLRVVLGSPWYGGKGHDEALYLAMIYGVAKAWSDRSDEDLIPIPLSKRLQFPFNISGHTEEWDFTSSQVGLSNIYGAGNAPNFDQRIENHPISGIRSMSCLKRDAMSDFYKIVEPENAVRTRPHAIIGSTSDNSLSGLITHTITDLPLSHAATFYETPVLGWWFRQKDFADKSLHAYYLRVNSIGMEYPLATMRLLDYFGYRRFAIVTSGVSRGFVRDIKKLASSDVELLVENMDLPNPCSDKFFVASCHQAVMNAMTRLKERDARIIVHEQDGATQLDVYWTSFTGLLRSDTLYIQINAAGDCLFPLIPPADGTINGDILWSNIYRGASANNKGEWDLMGTGQCTVCPNFAFQDLSASSRSNKTRVAEYNSQATSGVYTWASICPAVPTVRDMMNCDWCDTHAAYWINPTCEPEMDLIRRNFKGAMCIGLAKDNSENRTAAWLKYLSSLTADDLVAAGAPKSFFDVFDGAHPLYKKTGVSMKDLWKGRWDALFRERVALIDSLLLTLVAFNEWIRAAGDSSDALMSTQIRTGFRTVSSTPIVNWMATLKSSVFEGLTGPVSFNTQGERNVDYVVYSAQGQNLALTPVFRLSSSGELVKLVGEVTFNDGSSTPPFDREQPCEPGHFYNVAIRGCDVCPVGSSCVGARFPPIPCVDGTVAPTAKLTSCIECPVGTTSVNGSECRACAPGFHAPVEAMAACVPCPAGTSWETQSAPADLDSLLTITNVSVCVPCAFGRFAQLGDVTCRACTKPHTTTLHRGSISHLDCICEEGFYRECIGGLSNCPLSDYAEEQTRDCHRCPEGMTCDVGSDMANLYLGLQRYPKNKPGYVSLGDAPLHVYMCKPAVSCPGGVPETCFGGRTGPACGRCPLGLTLFSDGSCRPCESQSYFGMAVYFVIIFVSVILLYVSSSGARQWRGDAGEASIMGVTVSLQLAQILAVLTLTTVEWPEALASFVEGGGAVEFKVPFQCVFANISHPYFRYLGGLCTVPIVLACSWCVYLATACLPYSLRWRVSRVFSMCGKIFATLFTSQVTLCMLPFMCYVHPNQSDSSVIEFSATICGTGDHIVMVLIAVVGLLCCIGYVSYCMRRLSQMGSILSLPDAQERIEWILFLFEDFRHGCSHTFLWLKLKEFALPLVMVVAPSDSSIQILFFTLILLLCMFLSCRYYPWKIPFFNLMDLLTHACILTLLMLSKDYVPRSEDYTGSRAFAMILGAACAAGFTAMLLVPFANRALRGRTGQLFQLMTLGPCPSEQKLHNIWTSVQVIEPEDLHLAMSQWQIYDCNIFVSCLDALQPSEFVEHLVHAAMETDSD
eukprot:TRINITY_DN18014_c0_g2_i1.p1 TRINITY_DN18014_c0_g2~~TRINITY_DN18014_c0_g2_i1.p1  ORF type:complete len:1409 (-),score=124.84 TRINITY_DN18014_c0_g2_i1:152-4123(-)